MEYLSENGFKSISANNINQLSKYPKERLFILTFDDGWLGNYLYAFPILRKYGFNTLFFIALDRVGTYNFMNWGHIRRLRDHGMFIGSHTMSHRPLHTLTKEETHYELYESKKIITEKLGVEVNYLSVPHGSYNKTVIQIAKEIGYKYIFTSDIIAKFRNPGNSVIPRIPIKKSYSMKQFIKIMEQDRSLLFRLKIISTIKSILKQSIGMNNYRMAYRSIKGIKLE